MRNMWHSDVAQCTNLLANFKSAIMFRIVTRCSDVAHLITEPEQYCSVVFLVPGISKLFDIAGTQNIFVARFVPHVPLCSALFRFTARNSTATCVT